MAARPSGRRTRGLVLGVVLAVAAGSASAQDAGTERPVVALLPFGKVERPYLEAVTQAIDARMNVEVRVEPERPLPKEAFYPPRKRYRAEKLLDAVDADPPQGAWKVLAVTHAEISTTKGEVYDWGIAGLGNIGGRSCVVSTFLYRKHSKTMAVTLRRFADVAVHELGHTLGLPHCPIPACVMRDAQGKAIKSADTSSGYFCAYCRARVRPGVLKPDPR